MTPSLYPPPSSPFQADIFQCSQGSLDLLQENIHTEQGVI